MPELIDRHALLKKVYEHTQERERMTDGEWCRKCIYEAPTIEAEPVRHGRWIRNATSEGYHCSNCGHNTDLGFAPSEMIDPRDYPAYLDKYCGGCGAQMYADGGTISKERFAEIMTEILGGAENESG